jgi:hypothetical protein
VRAEADGRVGEHLAVADPERPDPPLPAGDVADERPELDELRLGEVRVQLLPERVVGELRIPADRVGVPERDALALVEERRRLVPVELRELVLRRRLPSRPDGALVPSVVAVERLRDPEPAELLQLEVDDAALEQPLPAVQERPGTSGWRARIAWISGRGVLWSMASSSAARSSGSSSSSGSA